MNSTIWNSYEEAVLHFSIGIVTIFINSYAIFLCYAVYDYQGEKPNDEKSPIDILIKDSKSAEFWVLYTTCFVQFISLFTPPITFPIVYLISHIILFLTNFYLVSFFVLLYINYVYVFQHEQFLKINVSSMRWKSLAWKFLLTFLSLFLSAAVPFERIPPHFQMLQKDHQYDR